MSMKDRIAAMTPDRIGRIRQSRGWTLAKFADAIGCSPRTAFSIASGERGVTPPECVFLEQIEAGLECPMPA